MTPVAKAETAERMASARTAADPSPLDSTEYAFRWLCGKQSADDLADLIGVDRDEILLWHREGMPGELPLHVEAAIERRAKELNGPAPAGWL